MTLPSVRTTSTSTIPLNFNAEMKLARSPCIERYSVKDTFTTAGGQPVATIQRDRNSGLYIVTFQYKNHEYHRSIMVKDTRAAEQFLQRLEATLARVERGELTVPPTSDPAVFILTQGTQMQGSKKGGDSTTRGLIEASVSIPH